MGIGNREVYEIYKNRLLDFSGKNKLISFKGTSKCVDLMQLRDFINPEKDMFSQFKIKITQKDWVDKYLNDRVNKIIENYNKKEVIMLEKGANPVVKKVKSEIDINFIRQRETENLCYEFNAIMEKIIKLKKESDLNYKETGKSTLYIDYMFLSGELRGDNILKMFAPLFLIPISVDCTKTSFTLIRDYGDVFFNRTMLIALIKTLGVKFNIDSYELSDFNEDIIENYLSRIEEMGVELTRHSCFEKFVYENTVGFEVHNYFVLSNMEISNSIYDDYEKMGDIKNQSVENLLNDDIVLLKDKEEFEDKYNKLNFSNKYLNLISRLDTSQELAVFMAKELDNLVIYGPPGTGKSQTILNIITDSLSQGKKVLVVSEKKAAINVIYNRLKGLQKLALMFDSSSIRMNQLKDTINNNLELLVEKPNRTTKELLGELENKINYFEDLHNILSKDINGATISTWYSEYNSNDASEIEKQEDFEYFLLKDKELSNYLKTDYTKFKWFVDNLSNQELVDELQGLLRLRKTLSIYELLVLYNINSKMLKFELIDLERDSGLLLSKINRIKEIVLRVNIIEGLEVYKKFLDSYDLKMYKPEIERLSSEIEKTERNISILENSISRFNYFIEKMKKVENLIDLGDLKESYSKNSDLFLNNYLSADMESYLNYKYEYLKRVKNVFTKIFSSSSTRKYAESQSNELYGNLMNKMLGIIKQLNENIENLKANNTSLMNSKKEVEEQELKLLKEYQDFNNYKEELDRLSAEKSLLEREKEEIYLKLPNICKLREKLDIDGYLSNVTELSDILRDFRSNENRIRFLITEYKELMKLIYILNKYELLEEDFPEKLWNLYVNRQIYDIELNYFQNVNKISEYKKVKTDYDTVENEYFSSNVYELIDKVMKNIKHKRNSKGNFMLEDAKFNREIGNHKRTFKVRQFMDVFVKVLLEYFPIILATPDAVSKYIPLEQDLFDTVIFDEASQLLIENAIPSIYRSKNVIVVGDDKQLKPSKFFKTTSNLEEEINMISDERYTEEEFLFMPDSLTLLSLLDIAKGKYNSVSLLYHYRSKFSELINFSNAAFYKGHLKLAPNVLRSENNDSITRIKVNGVWEKQQNIVEAEKVVELLKEIFENRKNNETIGIITFNAKQKDCIEKTIDKYCKENSNFDLMYSKEVNRTEDMEDKSLFIKNIENVQGDERDIIIFSVGYSYNKNGRLTTFFGPLSVEGGENRLNVAISRAKKKVYVITSFEPEDLNIENAKNNGSRYFKSYLEYVKNVSNKNIDKVDTIIGSFELVEENKIVKDFSSPFERQVYNALIDMGYAVDIKVGCSGFLIDLAIYDKDTGNYLLGIECDGDKFRKITNIKEREIVRQSFLESCGWSIYKVWSFLWWKDQNSVLEDIKYLVNKNKHSSMDSKKPKMTREEFYAELENVKDKKEMYRDYYYDKDKVTEW